MSNIYIQEPPTEGKVLLVTTVGEIEIELWSKECPLACRNFVQLCLEKYYNKTKFHRVVKDFIVQGGDPTETGSGGESIWGKPFKDEFHSRLRFVRRGLVAMANAGKDDNGSQFFFTMGPTQELQNKHTIFGKVAGDTIYNLPRLQEGVIGPDDRPMALNMILKTKVLSNPFPDIEPRRLIESLKVKEKSKDKRPQSKMKATKDFSLLSFGDEAEEEEEDLQKASREFTTPKGKSSHDLLKDPKLLSEVPEGMEQGRTRKDSAGEDEITERLQGTAETTDIQSIKDKLKRNAGKSGALAPPRKKGKEDMRLPETTMESEDEDEEKKAEEKRRLEVKREIRQLKKHMRKKDSGVGEKEVVEEKASGRELTEEEENNDMLRQFHQEREKYAAKPKAPKKGSSREDLTMKLLEKFKTKLQGVKEAAEDGPAAPVKKDSAGADEDDDLEGDDWMANELRFESNDPVLAKDASSKDDDWFDIYDPRNPVNKRRRKEDAKKFKKK